MQRVRFILKFVPELQKSVLSTAILIRPAPPHLCRSLALHRGQLEDALFTKDISQFDLNLCVDMLSVCDPHELSSSGEL